MGKYEVKKKRYLELAMKAKDGDDGAFEDLCSEMRPLILHIHQYLGCGKTIPPDEAYTIGCGAVFRAVQGFDPEKGSDFWGYCYKWVKLFIKNEMLAIYLPVRVPTKTHHDRMLMMKVLADMKREMGRDPTLEELAERIGKKIKFVRRVFFAPANSAAITRVDEEIEDAPDNGNAICDDGPMPWEPMDMEMRMDYLLSIVMDTVGERPYDMIMKFLGIDQDKMTVEEIASLYGVSRQAVSAQIMRSLDKIKIALLLDNEIFCRKT